MIDLPDDVRPLFLAAGWHPDRHVPVEPHVPTDHPAFGVLQTFGGLRVGSSGQGRECAASDVDFHVVYIDDVDEEVATWGRLLGSRLIEIAAVQNNHATLYIDTAGRCFSSWDDGFGLDGWTFEEAMHRLLLGYRARPMLLPEEHEVTAYGMTFRKGDPQIFDWTAPVSAT